MGLATVGFSQSIVYTNGVANNISNVKPSDNWDPYGIIHDFSLTSFSTISSIRFQVLDGTNAQGQVSSISQVRLRIYDITNLTLSSLTYNHTPVIDRTYSTGNGTLLKTLAGTRFTWDIEFFDMVNTTPFNLGAGHYGIFYMLPGSSDPDHYLMSSTPAVAGDGGAVFGPNANTPIGGPDSEAAFTLFGSVPEPATLAVLGAGALLALRRKRR